MISESIRTTLFCVASGLLGATPLTAQVRFQVTKPEVVKLRLQGYKGNDLKRESTLKALFTEVGCTPKNLSEQPVKNLKEPNLLCALPGSSDSIIVVAAHFDHVDRGDGVVDNWSGASLLPSLYQAISGEPRRHTFIFAAFAGEEKGLVGSQFYVGSLSAEQLKRIDAMINLDTLGLGPTKVWVSRSDRAMVSALVGFARLVKSPLAGVDVDQVGMSDEEPFIARKIPAIMIHSVTQETLNILHGPFDAIGAIHFDDYYETYRLLSGYLAFLDNNLARASVPAAATPPE